MGDTKALVHTRTYSLAMAFSQNIKYLMRSRGETMFFELCTLLLPYDLRDFELFESQ